MCATGLMYNNYSPFFFLYNLWVSWELLTCILSKTNSTTLLNVNSIWGGVCPLFSCVGRSVLCPRLDDTVTITADFWPWLPGGAPLVPDWLPCGLFSSWSLIIWLQMGPQDSHFLSWGWGGHTLLLVQPPVHVCMEVREEGCWARVSLDPATTGASTSRAHERVHLAFGSFIPACSFIFKTLPSNSLSSGQCMMLLFCSKFPLMFCLLPMKTHLENSMMLLLGWSFSEPSQFPI